MLFGFRKAAAPAKPTTSATPRRLSLADLKEAAQQRKAN
jgi:hypothetical protein